MPEWWTDRRGLLLGDSYLRCRQRSCTSAKVSLGSGGGFGSKFQLAAANARNELHELGVSVSLHGDYGFYTSHRSCHGAGHGCYFQPMKPATPEACLTPKEAKQWTGMWKQEREAGGIKT